MHRAAPGATEYNGIAIHVKGRERKLAKALAKTKPQHDHKHDEKEHDHETKKAAPPKAKTRAKKA
jgi:tmRNA-binding protein